MRLCALVHPLPTCGDYLPLLAIQDGRLGEMVRQCRDDIGQAEALVTIFIELYPNRCCNG